MKLLLNGKGIVNERFQNKLIVFIGVAASDWFVIIDAIISTQRFGSKLLLALQRGCGIKIIWQRVGRPAPTCIERNRFVDVDFFGR